MTAAPLPQPAPYSVPARIALLSMIGFWLFYFVSVTLRAEIIARPGYNAMTMDNRALVALCGIGFTWLLYLALERFSRRALRTRVIAAFVLSALCATA